MKFEEEVPNPDEVEINLNSVLIDEGVAEPKVKKTRKKREMTPDLLAKLAKGREVAREKAAERRKIREEEKAVKDQKLEMRKKVLEAEKKEIEKSEKKLSKKNKDDDFDVEYETDCEDENDLATPPPSPVKQKRPPRAPKSRAPREHSPKTSSRDPEEDEFQSVYAKYVAMQERLNRR